jgi:acetyltransferase-like isoleucine patch superfamily enzyme
MTYLKYRIFYPNTKIAFGARILKSSKIGENVNIGIKSTIIDSILSDSVTIYTGCTISKCLLEKNTVVYPGSSLSEVNLGRFSYIGKYSELGRTRFGSFCSCGPSLLVGSGDHPRDYISSSPVFYSTLEQCGISFADRDYFDELKETIIGNDVWIGARVFIKDGVKIGHGAIIGAGAVVVDDVPPYGIVGGVPAKLIRFRFSEAIIKRLLEVQWWNWNRDKLQKAQALFAQEDVNAFIEWVCKESR